MECQQMLFFASKFSFLTTPKPQHTQNSTQKPVNDKKKNGTSNVFPDCSSVILYLDLSSLPTWGGNFTFMLNARQEAIVILLDIALWCII